MKKPSNDLRSFFFKTKDEKFNICLAPKGECKAKAIRAHTVQNSRALELLVSKDNHVIGLEIRFSENKGPEFIYKRIPRDSATTFTGLCSEHDAKIFKPIDTQKIDTSNEEHCFLLAFRAVMRELHATIDVASKYQQTYYKIEEPYKYPSKPIGISGIEATKSLINSYETYQYKFKYDFIYEYKAYEYIEDFSIIIENQKPSVAASSMFSVDNMKNSEGDTLRIVINILPISTEKTIVLFSWLSHETEAVRTKLGHIFLATGELRKYEISKLILEHCENFILSEEFYLTWSEEKKSIIKQYFVQNLQAKKEINDQNLMLFWEH
jgi:hypothetical protein